MDEAEKVRILEWQDRLHKAFDYNHVLGGRFLLPAMHLEESVGQLFVQKFHGHRLLTDAFLDFFAETLQTQAAYHWRYGWPSNQSNYAVAFLMYVTMVSRRACDRNTLSKRIFVTGICPAKEH
jgi:hypothetical protein